MLAFCAKVVMCRKDVLLKAFPTICPVLSMYHSPLIYMVNTRPSPCLKLFQADSCSNSSDFSQHLGRPVFDPARPWLDPNDPSELRHRILVERVAAATAVNDLRTTVTSHKFSQATPAAVRRHKLPHRNGRRSHTGKDGCHRWTGVSLADPHTIPEIPSLFVQKRYPDRPGSRLAGRCRSGGCHPILAHRLLGRMQGLDLDRWRALAAEAARPRAGALG